MKTAIIAAMAAASISAPALAQNADNFTGPHAEIITGYDAVDTNSIAGTPDGVLYGFNLGYDVKAGPVILGIEGEISDSSAKRTIAGTRLETDRDLYVGGRIGVPLSSKALAYGKVGYTNARLEYSGLVNGHDNGDGVRVGAGLEYKLNANLFLKGEYRYSNYEGDVERHQAVTGIGWRF